MRRRILLAIIAAATLGVILFSVPLGFALRDLYYEEEVARLQGTAAEAAERVPPSFPVTNLPVRLPRPGSQRTVSLYNPAGIRVTGEGPIHADKVVRGALHGDARATDTPRALVFATPVTRGAGVVGAIRAASPHKSVSDRTRRAVAVMFGIGVLAIGASALLALWQSRRLARPVTQLAEEARRLGDGDFTVRAEPSGISEIDAVSSALGATAVRLDQLLTRERAFSADASHQLRTPLTSLRLTLEAASLDPLADRDAAIAAAIDEADRLERTVDDLLALAREVPAARPLVDLGEFLDPVAREWRGRLSPSGRALRLTVEPELPAVSVSDRALRQILDVLIDNAQSHGAGPISVRARRAPTGVALEVSDDGDGITGDPSRIFERRAPSAAGHGIGLALARSLADAEGARLVLEDPGPRPVFAVVLPVLAPAEPELGG